jgi:branched-chain amino acid transport system ATP-binding protein
VLENVILAVQGCLGHAYHFWQPARETAELVRRADAVIELIGLARSATPRRAAGLRAAAPAGDGDGAGHAAQVLLLDEPMAGMGPVESAQIVALLQRLKGQYGILLIEHDMDAVFALADRISVLFHGKVIYCGDPAAVRSTRWCARPIWATRRFRHERAGPLPARTCAQVQ